MKNTYESPRITVIGNIPMEKHKLDYKQRAHGGAYEISRRYVVMGMLEQAKIWQEDGAIQSKEERQLRGIE